MAEMEANLTFKVKITYPDSMTPEQVLDCISHLGNNLSNSIKLDYIESEVVSGEPGSLKPLPSLTLSRITEEDAIDCLKGKRNTARAMLNARGGRGVELANEVDRYEYALDALHGDLNCCHCEAKLV